MQSLSTAYTVYFNKRHRRHGHLLDGRYKANTDQEFSEALRASPSAIGDEEFLRIAERLRRKGCSRSRKSLKKDLNSIALIQGTA